MTKKYCALEKLHSLGTCKRNCHQCTWLMSKEDLEDYCDRQETDLAKKYTYQYSVKG